MDIYKLIEQFEGVLPLSVGFHASNSTGAIRSADDLESLRKARDMPPVGSSVVAYRLLGQRGRDHHALTQLDDKQTRKRLFMLHGRAVVYLERM